MTLDFTLTPRDVLFFRDARPMDTAKARRKNLRLIGHGAQWPRPDLLYSAVMHALLGSPDTPEETLYGANPDLRVWGPFPERAGRLFLPCPLDWDMRVACLPEGTTDLPAPLTHGFLDRTLGKKALPAWIAIEDYARYLTGGVAVGEAPPAEALWQAEPRVGTALDDRRGTARRAPEAMSAQWQMEVLRLAQGVTMRCAVEQAKADALVGRDVRFGGQGGTVRFDRAPAGAASLLARLEALPKGTPGRWVRWTLLAPALFMKGWYPNWLDDAGRVMLPTEAVARRPGETRAAWRQRARAEWHPFESARLVAARVGKSIAFSGWDTLTREKPTELAVPAGSAYLFECRDVAEAQRLVGRLNLKTLSDLGPQGFGLGICSYLSPIE